MNIRRLSLLVIPLTVSAIFTISAPDASAQSWDQLTENGRAALSSKDFVKAEKSFSAALTDARAKKNNAHTAQSTSDLGQVALEQARSPHLPTKYIPGSVLLLLILSLLVVLKLSLTKTGFNKKWLANYGVSYLTAFFGTFLYRGLIGENLFLGAGIFAAFFSVSSLVTATISGAWKEQLLKHSELAHRTTQRNVKVLYVALSVGIFLSLSAFGFLYVDAGSKQKHEFQTAMFTKSEKLLNESLALWKNEKSQNAKEQAHTYANLGNVYSEWNMPAKASSNFKQSVECAKKTNNIYLISEAVADYAKFLEKDGDKKREKELYSGLLASLEPKFKTAKPKHEIKTHAKIKGKNKRAVSPVDKDLEFARERLVSWKKKVATL